MPIVLCDARQRDSVKRVLTTLVSHVLEKMWPSHELRQTPLTAT